MTYKRRGPPRDRKPFVREVPEWFPITDTGRKVKSGQITSIEEVFSKNLKIMEPEIIDMLIPDLKPPESLGFNRTTRMNRNGRQISYQIIVIIGNGNGYVGVGIGKSSMGARVAFEQATRQAKLNILRVKRGCGSWECTCGEPHTVPFKVIGKSGSVNIELIPAPRGLGIKTGNTAKKVFALAGITDVWIKTKGNTRSKANFSRGVLDALNATNYIKGNLAMLGVLPSKPTVETVEASVPVEVIDNVVDAPEKEVVVEGDAE